MCMYLITFLKHREISCAGYILLAESAEPSLCLLLELATS